MFRLILLFGFAASIHAAIIPRPLSLSSNDEIFVLPNPLPVELPPDAAPFYSQLLMEAGINPIPATKTARSLLSFRQIPLAPDESPEAYRLSITPQGIEIQSSTHAGRTYAMQSLAQWIAATAPAENAPRQIKCVTISDAPRFRWRGFMLDEGRHFAGEENVKHLLDAMSRYKMNRFHWHLTDSGGWRIEIKKFPKLTSEGGRGSETDRRPDAPARFYTQEQIKEIVAYAKMRGITIIPEIDMPGHADAAVRAYPEHDGGGYIQKNNPQKWPHFTFNPAKPETRAFLDDILAEVATLFPDAGVIHFGGDEVHFGWHKWPKLPDVQELMAKENLKDLAAVETRFMRQTAATINQLGFKAGGWDEIASRGLDPAKTIVWWWRHDQPNVLHDALQAGYPIVLTPRRPCYLDFLQEKTHKDGRNWNGINELADCYHFPEPLKLSPKDESLVLGIQGSLWGETTVTQKRRDFLTWPRLIALAEAAWTKAERKDFVSFQDRLKPELVWLQRHGIQPYDPFKKSPEVSDQSANGEYLDNAE